LADFDRYIDTFVARPERGRVLNRASASATATTNSTNG
jgi:hypothetical protein